MDFIITNNGVAFQNESDILKFDSNNSVYEVVRIIDGAALFLEDHFSRLIHSALIREIPFEMEISEFKKKIEELIKSNQKPTGNMKFVLTAIDNEIHSLFSFIPHIYPTDMQYKLGVPTDLLFAERLNPNAKIIQNTIREKANQLIADRRLYEALLVDHDGLITEGSRSNVFFVKDNRFYTAPSSKVLVGITRQKVIECLSELNYPIVEEAVSVSDLAGFDAVFLTGTSPKVLPVNCIGVHHFSVGNNFVEQLMVKYDSVIKHYINERIK